MLPPRCGPDPGIPGPRPGPDKGGPARPLRSPGQAHFAGPRARSRTWGSRAAATELRRALDDGDLRVHYQPVVDLGSGKVTSLEALVRWQHPSRGLVGPDEFVPVAERHGLIARLTTFVVGSASRQLLAWHARGWPNLTCAVNLSVLNLTDEETLEELITQLAAMDGRLTVEITESSMAGATAVRALARLSGRGVPCAIDDFGTGYSSLAALKQLPAQALKIDRGFLRGIEEDERDRAVVRAIVTMAEAFDLAVVAEGIETPAAARQARAAGVTHGQGYWFARPMPAAAMDRWLATRPRGREAADG